MDAPRKKRSKPTKPVPREIAITPAMLRQAEELAGYGLTNAQIASVLGMAERTMRQKKADSDELDAALTRGRAKAAGVVGKALFLKAKEGDVAAIRWWEMTRQGRSEKQQTTAEVKVTNDAVADARLARIIEETALRLEAGTHQELPPPMDA
jgi:hypothetical protein